ncbi:MAG: DegT/DnrJ/EryC1/StrS family aminotransferase [Magnetococcus sp. DMHC-6]
MTPSFPFLPLARPELTEGDVERVLEQLARAPFQESRPLLAWEYAWSQLWERSAVAFADPSALILALKEVLGWRSGEGVWADSLLHPVWREGLAAAWLSLELLDMDPLTGFGIRSPEGGRRVVGHPFGLVQAFSDEDGFVLEDISALLKPRVGSGNGAVQLAYLDGNAMVCAGASCVALSRDAALIAALRQVRTHPPGPASCVLGLATLERLDWTLKRRQELAENYLALYDRGRFIKPCQPAAGRAWDGFFISFTTRSSCLQLQNFLTTAGIGCGPPVWFSIPERGHLPGLNRFLENSLALPFYASLRDQEQKRVINRVHRWVERGRFE